MSADEYVPTTEQVRDFWASDGKLQPAAKSHDHEESAAEFDRWLAARDAEQQRIGAVKALREVIALVDSSPTVTWTGKGGAKERIQAEVDRIEQEGKTDDR